MNHITTTHTKLSVTKTITLSAKHLPGPARISYCLSRFSSPSQPSQQKVFCPPNIISPTCHSPYTADNLCTTDMLHTTNVPFILKEYSALQTNTVPQTLLDATDTFGCHRHFRMPQTLSDATDTFGCHRHFRMPNGGHNVLSTFQRILLIEHHF